MAIPTITAQELYFQTVRDLPPTERLRLAALILEDLAQPNVSIVDSGEAWSEQDQREVTAFSLQYAATIYPEDEEIV